MKARTTVINLSVLKCDVLSTIYVERKMVIVSNSKSTFVYLFYIVNVMYSSVQLLPMNEIELKDDDPTIIPRNCKENSPTTSTKNNV